MAISQNQRLRRAAEKASRRKAVIAEKRKAETAEMVGGEARVITEAARSPIHGALVSDELFELGIGYLVMARVLPSGSIAASIFLVDIWCLGVKDAFFRVMKRNEFTDLVTRTMTMQKLVTIEPPEARALLHGAVAYAASLGLPASEDYAKIEAIFGDVPVADTAFPMGKDGKPFFVPGPHDSPIKVKRIMAAIAEHRGAENFDFLMSLDKPPAAFVDAEWSDRMDPSAGQDIAPSQRA